MLRSLTGDEIDFHYFSSKHNRLKATISLHNNNQSYPIFIKIKSTSRQLFQAWPSKAIIQPNHTICITITTADEIIGAQLKALQQKHKFIVEYLVLDGKENSPNVQHYQAKMRKNEGKREIKFSVCTDNVKEYQQNSDHQQPDLSSIDCSSYRSFNGQDIQTKQNSQSLRLQKKIFTPKNNQQQIKINQEIFKLQSQRLELLKNLYADKHDTRPNLIISVFILILTILVGNYFSKKYNLAQNIESLWMNRVEQNEGGFIQFFNFHQKEEESASWWSLI